MKENNINVLFVGGSDSIGKAGIQAGIRQSAILNINSLCIITMVTAQNYDGVYNIQNITSDIFKSQLDAILKSKLSFKYINLSLFGCLQNLKYLLKNTNNKKIIFDPVITTKSGYDFLKKNNYKLWNQLYSSSFLITPNITEFCIMANIEKKFLTKLTVESYIKKFSQNNNIKNIILKNFKCSDNKRANILYQLDYDLFSYFYFDTIQDANSHGSGCNFAANITCNLALGKDLKKSIKIATNNLVKVLSINKSL